MSQQIVISENQAPLKGIFNDNFERGLDPWHSDAFKGTPMEGYKENKEPRKTGWYVLDWCGNVLGFIPDGTIFEVDE